MSAPGAPPQLHLVADVPGAYAAIALAALRARDTSRPFRLACSGGSAGRACLDRLVSVRAPWDQVDLYFVDERCVPYDSPDSNARSLSEALGAHLAALAGYHPIDWEAGPTAYESVLESAGGLDLVQLGMGPDGHTASLFPGSPGLEAPPERLAVANADPSGRNPHERISLTFGAIAGAALAVVTALGTEKHDPLARLLAGEDLPAGRLRARRLLWLVDPAAAGDLPVVEGVPEDLLAPGPAGSR